MTIDQAKSNIHARVLYFPYDECKVEDIEFGMLVGVVQDSHVLILLDGDPCAKCIKKEKVSLDDRHVKNNRSVL